MAAAETIDTMIRRLTSEFRNAGLDQPALDARLIVAAAMGLSAERLMIDGTRSPTAEESQRIATFRGRRLAHEPVSRIIGQRGFFGRDFVISPAVLDPRPETELLVETALALIDRMISGGAAPSDRPLTVLDVGTGSGAIIISILAERAELAGLGIDPSPHALEISHINAERIGVHDRLQLIEMPAERIDGLRFEVLLANLPYIATADIAMLAPDVAQFDPLLALDGGADGLRVFAQLFQALDRADWMGLVLLEVGAGQSAAVVRLAHQLWPMSAKMRYHVALDLAGHDRCVIFEPHA